MKRKVGLLLAVSLTGSALLAIALSTVGESANLFAFRSEADLSYTLTLNNSNKYDGNATRSIYNDNNNYAVQFSYSGCSTNQSGHVTLNNNGTLKNDQQITSVSALYPVFTASSGASLKFRASYNGTKWGEYSLLTSEKTYDLSASNPYYIELKAEGGSVNLTSLRYSYTCAANPDAAGGEEEWQVVTDESNLKVGDQVVIATAESDVSYAISTTQNNNNRAATSITKDNSKGTITLSNNVQVFTLAAGTNGLFAFDTGNGYLKASSSSKNYMTTSSVLDDNSSFSIALSNTSEISNVASIVADNSSNRNVMQFNPNNGTPIFSCYATASQSPLSIYKKSSGASTPAYEVGLSISDAKDEANGYTVTQSFDSFVENGGLTVSAMMSNGSSKKLSKTDYSYKLTHSGVEQNPTQNFAHAGDYDVSVTYKSLIPSVYTINVANVVTSIEATKTTTSYHVNDTIVLTDISAVKNYQVDGSSNSIVYSNFAANGLSLELRNPNNQVVTSGTFNVAGNWTAKVYLTADSAISSTITISVTTIPVSSISLNKESTTVYIGTSETLTAQVLPENATDKTVIWSIRNASPTGCLTVNNSGTITGVSVGSATLVATAGEKEATCNVTIASIPVSSVSLNKASTSISIGASETLTATISPTNASNKEVNWTSSNTSIATVNANGVVTGVKEGNATITVTTVDGEKTASCTVSVTKVAVTSITLNPTSMTLYVGGSTGTISATVNPSNATYKTVTWSSNKTNIATVNNGVVTPVAAGTATITALADGISNTCEVTVSSAKPEWIKVTDASSLSAGDKLLIGESSNGYVNGDISSQIMGVISSEFNNNKVEPGSGYVALTLGGSSGSWTLANSSNELLGATAVKKLAWDYGTTTWSISINSSGATIQNGNSDYGRFLYNHNQGTPRFTTYTSSTSASMILPSLYRLENGSSGGGDTPATIDVTGVELNKDNISLTVGESDTLTATVSPANATNKNVTWSSNNESVATVTNGTVTAVAAGTAVITVTTVDQGKKDTCNVTVTSPSGGGATDTVEGSVTAESGALSGWEESGTGSAYADGTVKMDSSGDNVYKTDIFSASVASGMTSLTVTVNGKINGTPTASNSYKIEALDSSGNVLTNVTRTGVDVVGTSYGNTVFTINSNLTGCTGFRIIYLTKGAGNWGIKSVSWSATYSSEPIAATNLSIVSSATASVGSPKTLDVTYTPTNANTGLGVKWSSSNTSVATIDEDSGLITPKAAGTTTITAKLASNLTKTSICTLTVTEQSLDKWTIMVYLCGSTLEYNHEDTRYGPRYEFASNDIKEMLSVTSMPDDINILVETGGVISSGQWYLGSSYLDGATSISTSKLQRWTVKNQKLHLEETLNSNQMSSKASLQSFIEWGLSDEYAAENTALILWDHGGGIGGVCGDYNYTDSYGWANYLNCSEVAQATKDALAKKNKDKLTWIGYDACLMGVADLATVNADYFDYMIASQETEPGGGWDYEAWFATLKNKKANTTENIKDIMHSICTSFVADQSCTKNSPCYSTLAVYDLSKAAALVTAFNSYASSLGINSKNAYSKVKTAYQNCYSFGADSDGSLYGCGDFIDFLAKMKSQYTTVSTTAVENAIRDMVIYNEYCERYSNTSITPCGVCVFVPETVNATEYGLQVEKSDYSTNDPYSTKFTEWRRICYNYGTW